MNTATIRKISEWAKAHILEEITKQMEGESREAIENASAEWFFRLIAEHCLRVNGLAEEFEGKEKETIGGAFADVFFPLGERGNHYPMLEEAWAERFLTELDDQAEKSEWSDARVPGHLYQAFNSERFDRVYDGTLSREPVPKHLLSAATMVYTPDWAALAMAENSVGALWRGARPETAPVSAWKYLLPVAKQSEETKRTLEEYDAKNRGRKPEDLRIIDPCMGSGHLLLAAFDTLLPIYRAEGIDEKTAARSILENNLYGLEIDERAARFAAFSLLLRAALIDPSILTSDVRLSLAAFREPGELSPEARERFVGEDERLGAELSRAEKELENARELGSLLTPGDIDLDMLFARAEELGEEGREVLGLLKPLELLARRYDVVITNPPYLGSARFSDELREFVKESYPLESTELSSAMYRKAVGSLVRPGGFVSFICSSSWMFLARHERMRRDIASVSTLTDLIDYGTELFDGKVGHIPTVSWTARAFRAEYVITAVRLADYCYQLRDQKEEQLFNPENRYYLPTSRMEKIPGYAYAYRATDAMLRLFEGRRISDAARVVTGMTTADNARFVRYWYEVDPRTLSVFGGKRWYPYRKGGEYRKWYGNDEFVVNWENDGEEIRANRDPSGRLRSGGFNGEYAFREGLTWTYITLGDLAVRYAPADGFFDNKGSMVFFETYEDMMLALAFLTTPYANEISKILNPTISFQPGNMGDMPFPELSDPARALKLAQECVEVARTDWRFRETSPQFDRHPLARMAVSLKAAWAQWERECEERYQTIRSNEIELDRMFREAAGEDLESVPPYPEKFAESFRADLARDLRGLISYAVGCMMGHYGPDESGVLLPVDWESPDANPCGLGEATRGILLIREDDFYPNDAFIRFEHFLRAFYGELSLKDNLAFIAKGLGLKGDPEQAIRGYFVRDFIKDHMSMYHRRPIYWLFESGERRGLQLLVSIHEFRDNLPSLLIDKYVSPLIEHLETRELRQELESLLASNEDYEKSRVEAERMQAQLEELIDYREKLRALAEQGVKIDRDAGVKENLKAFSDVLASAMFQKRH